MVELTIRYDQEKDMVQLQGPTGNRLLCYGLLDMAREILTRKGIQQAQQTQPKIVKPGLNDIMGGGFKT